MNYSYQKNDDLTGKTITFYSYKGGVGRSMAMVNIACLMAKQKKKVLLIDWDLEAPGLHSFFSNAVTKDKLGLIDFITDVIENTQSDTTNNEEAYIDFLSEKLNGYIQKNVAIDKTEYLLDIIKAGRFDEDYTTKLNAIDWMGFYKNSPTFFRTFAQYLETKYDYILIDSRTGLSDTGGVCTMLMPQILVLVFALNYQNINGVLDVAKQSVNYRFDSNDYRDLKILPLPSRIDNQNSTELEVWIKKYTQAFEDLLKKLYLLDECKLTNYFNIAKIPYKPEHAYGEKIPVLTEITNNDFFISFHYTQFYKLIIEDKPIWEILSADEIEINRKQANSHFQKGLEYFYESNFKSSIIEFEKTCDLDKTNEAAYNNWGLTLGNLARTKEGKEAEELFHQSFEKFQKAIEIKPDNHEAYNNWGLSIGNLAKTKEGKEAEELYHLSFEKYQKAIEIKPDNHEVYNNWGIDLGNLAKTKEGKEAEEFYHQSFEKYQKAIEIKPDLHEAFYNWGLTLGNLARTKEGKEAEELYYQSFEKFQKGIEIKPDNHEAYNYWGLSIGNLAKTKEGREAEELYYKSFEKYQKAIEIKPDIHEAFYNWGTDLGNLAKTKEGKEAEELYFQSFEKLQKSLELGGKCYNLACWYALKDNNKEALFYLDLSLTKKEILVQFVENDNDWKKFLLDMEFINILNKYRKQSTRA